MEVFPAILSPFGCPHSVVAFHATQGDNRMGDNRMNRTEISNGQPERPTDLSLSRISKMCHSWPREVEPVVVEPKL